MIIGNVYFLLIARSIIEFLMMKVSSINVIIKKIVTVYYSPSYYLVEAEHIDIIFPNFYHKHREPNTISKRLISNEKINILQSKWWNHRILCLSVIDSIPVTFVFAWLFLFTLNIVEHIQHDCIRTVCRH